MKLNSKLSAAIENMTKKEIMELTGEDPEDMFGGDWKNEVEEIAETK